MAGFTWSCCLCLGMMVSLVHANEAVCGAGSTVTSICESGNIRDTTIFLESDTSILEDEQCDCVFVPDKKTTIAIHVVRPMTTMDCGPEILFSEVGKSREFFKVHCLLQSTSDHTEQIDPSTLFAMTATGAGQIKSCIMLRADPGTVITATCTERTKKPSTQPPTEPTTEPSTKSPTKPPTEPPTGPSTQPPTQPSTQPPSQSSSQPSQPPTQPPSQPPTQTPAQTSSSQPSAQPPTQTSSSQPSTQPPTQTPTQASNPASPQSTTQPQTQSSTQVSTGESTRNVAPATQPSTGLSGFPVEAVAGGVGGGIVLIILLVILITCCTSRSRPDKRQQDEEMLKGRDSPEMTEKEDPNANPLSFNNQLYYESGMGTPGKSVTPTVSDAGTDDYNATKGLDELYASVNKTITDSTDIM